MTELITSPSQLPSISEMGEAESNIIQINAARQVNGDNFRAGVIDFSWSLAGSQRASMKKSYIRIRAKLTKANNDQPTVSDRVAFAENFANNMFSSAYFYIGGVDVSSKQNFCAQSSMARARLTNTYSWFKSIGDVYGFDSNFSRRAAEISSDGNTLLSYFGSDANTALTGGVNTITALGVATFAQAQTLSIGDVIKVSNVSYRVVSATSSTVYNVVTLDGSAITPVVANTAATLVFIGAGFVYDIDDGKNDIEIVCQPGALGIWSSESCLPSGQYRLSLYPSNDASLTSAIECKGATTVAGDYKVTVSDMYFYLHTYRAVEPIVSGEYFLDLTEMSTQVKTLSGPTNNNFNFSIPASTYGIAIWAQSKTAGTTPLLPPSIFNDVGGNLLKLKNIQLTYAGISKPNTNWDSALGGDAPAVKNWLKQRYFDSMANAGLSELSAETYEEWLKRGILLYYSWVKSDDNRSTELQLSVDYEGSATIDNAHIFVGALYRNLCQISIDSGYITAVKKLQM